MTLHPKKPVVHGESGELLGFIAKDYSSWTAQTIFGYVIARVETQAAAEDIVRTQGRLTLQGMWRYQDTDHEWYPCVLKQVYEDRVVVVRTNELGFQEADSYKLVTIKNPSEISLQKA